MADVTTLPESEPELDRIELADWRRRVSDLYAEVRTTAATDPEAAWNRWREVREALYREHPQSPVPAAKRAEFSARHWPYDPALRFELPVLADEPAKAASDAAPSGFGGFGSLLLPVSTGGEQSFTRIGFLDVPFAAGERRLGLYWMAGYAGGLFLPFRDATNGAET
jgi:uncharacterized protein